MDMAKFARSLSRRGAAVAAALLLLLLAPLGGTASASPSAGPAGVVAPPAEPLSNYEVATGHSLDRDCGFTVPVLALYQGLPSVEDLWLFCDTIDYNASGTEVGAILGTDTAAEAPLVPGEVPQDLSELPTPPARPALPNDNGPQPFLPVPNGLVLPGSSSPCVGTGFSPTGVYGPASPGIYPASWFTGAARETLGFGHNPLDVLASFNSYCVDAETGNINTLFTDEAFGLVTYDPLTNTLGQAVDVFTSSGGTNIARQEQLGDPVFFGGYLYLFSSQCLASIFGVCTSGVVYMARVPAFRSGWANPAAYQWWTGSGWSSDYADAGNLIPAATPFGISVGDFSLTGHGIVLIAESDVAGGFQVFSAPSPTGTWALLETNRVPNSNDCNAGEFGCYALVAHPELSTPSELLLSYLDPSGLGHLRLAAFPWQQPAAG
jgi:hypothetical protein